MGYTGQYDTVGKLIVQQSWEPAPTGSLFQLIWLANLISTQSPVAQPQFLLDFPLHVVVQHLIEITGEIEHRSLDRAMRLKSGKKPPWGNN